MKGREASLSPVEQLREMIGGFRETQLIYVAAKLELADLVEPGGSSCEHLARRAGVDGRNLYRVLRALASLGVFVEEGERRFSLTPLGEALRSDRPDSVRWYAIMQGEPWMWRPMGELLSAVETGEVPFERLFGASFFDYLGADPERGAVFDRVQDHRAQREIGALLAAHDFSVVGTVCDVGGGRGGTLAAILRAQPEARGILFDLPSVLPEAARVIEAAGLAERCSLVGGSFFERVPPGADTYLLQAVLHDWDDDGALRILESCRRAMDPGSKLIIVDTMIPPGNEPDPTKLAQVTIMVILGGRDRTESEFAGLLEAAGLRMRRFRPVPPRVLIEAELA
jgi:SAM-dependent methyltransferase